MNFDRSQMNLKKVISERKSFKAGNERNLR